MKIIKIFLLSSILYNCSPINKQHGYLVDDILMSSEKIIAFSEGKTTKSEIFREMGSPSIEIYDVDDVWIYLLSLKEENIFENDTIEFQNIYRFKFNENGIMEEKTILTEANFSDIQFSKEKTRVIRDAYGITDQLYEAFTRGR